MIIQDNPDDDNKLLKAGIMLTSIPPDTEVKSVVVCFKDKKRMYPEHDLQRLEHLLQMLVDRGVRLQMIFDDCSGINLPQVRPFFKFIPSCETVSFKNCEPDVSVFMEIAEFMSNHATSLLEKLTLSYCDLTDDKLECLLPHLPFVRSVSLHCNPDITMATFQAIHDIILDKKESMVDIKIARLSVDYKLVKKVKKLLKRVHKIDIN